MAILTGRTVMEKAIIEKLDILTCDTCDGFRDYSQGDHGWPPPKVDLSLSPSSHLVSLFPHFSALGISYHAYGPNNQ